MKKILVFSDCHYDKKVVDLLMDKIDSFDYVYFCGDGIDNLTYYSYAYPNKIEAVRGNVDSHFGVEPYEVCNTVEGVRIFMTHGHLYNVKKGLRDLEIEARKRDAQIVVFGHTHSQTKIEKDGVIYVNPGCSCSLSGTEYAEIWLSEKNIEIYLRKVR